MSGQPASLQFFSLVGSLHLPMNRDFSLIDANLNRAKEGLRVAEDIIRFVLRNRELFELIKETRHNLQNAERAFGVAEGISARQEADIGQAKVLDSEYIRHSIWGLLRANFSRAGEAMRVLEEFGKIYLRDKAHILEEIRYDIYKLEFKTLTLTPHYWLNLYFSTGVVYPLSDSVDELIWLINHGAKIFQLRDKTSSVQDVFKKAKYICSYIKKREERLGEGDKVLFIMNDYLDIAAALPVAGVHIGQGDGNIVQARRRLGALKIIGRSNDSMEHIKKSVVEGADYASIGPVFETPIKADLPAVGLKLVKQVAEEITIPWLAIGGINKTTINQVYEAGAKNVAVVRSAREFFV